VPRPEQPLRVVHVPAAVGGHASMLAEAERRIGLDSRAIVLEPTTERYAADEVLAPPGTGRIRREWRRWRLVARLLAEADVVHYNFGRPLSPLPFPAGVVGPRRGGRLWHGYASLTQFADVRLLARRGKAIFVTYQGDDARPRRLARPELADLYDEELDRLKQRWIAQFDRRAAGIFALNPDLLRVLPPRAELVPYAHVDLEDWKPVAGAENEVPVVVHAPSDRRVKGTSLLVEAVERLRAEGVALELDVVEGLPREEARRRYERADVFVDQLLLGFYGGAAVELMALGKPVVANVGGEDLSRLPEEMRAQLPVVHADGSTIADELRRLVTAPRESLCNLGAASRSYVERWHDPLRIAARMRDAYTEALSRRITSESAS
jgi:glycosyltransferase involved in cell wall biosynthesis